MLKSCAPLCIFALERYPVGGRCASLSRVVDAAWFVCLRVSGSGCSFGVGKKPISPARLSFCSLFLDLLSRSHAQFWHRNDYPTDPRVTALWFPAIRVLYVSKSLTFAICDAVSVTTSASTNPAPMERESITKRAAFFASSSESNLSNQYLCLSSLSICHSCIENRTRDHDQGSAWEKIAD